MTSTLQLTGTLGGVTDGQGEWPDLWIVLRRG